MRLFKIYLTYEYGPLNLNTELIEAKNFTVMPDNAVVFYDDQDLSIRAFNAEAWRDIIYLKDEDES